MSGSFIAAYTSPEKKTLFLLVTERDTFFDSTSPRGSLNAFQKVLLLLCCALLLSRKERILTSKNAHGMSMTQFIVCLHCKYVYVYYRMCIYHQMLRIYVCAYLHTTNYVWTYRYASNRYVYIYIYTHSNQRDMHIAERGCVHTYNICIIK